MDRQDGTGRGHRGDRKGGAAGKGTWGDEKKPLIEGETAAVETAKPATEQREQRERKPREPRERRERPERPAEEEKKSEPVVEEEEVGFTLDDYFNQKKAKDTGLLKKGEVRAHEKNDAKNIADVKGSADIIAAGTSNLTRGDSHKISKGEGAELMGFGSVKEDDDFRGGRGGRGRGGYNDRP